jgi:hypothetical protein
MVLNFCNPHSHNFWKSNHIELIFQHWLWHKYTYHLVKFKFFYHRYVTGKRECVLLAYLTLQSIYWSWSLITMCGATTKLNNAMWCNNALGTSDQCCQLWRRAEYQLLFGNIPEYTKTKLSNWFFLNISFPLLENWWKKKSLSTSLMSQIIYFQSNSFYLPNENSIHISMENLI